ncbi:DUF2961 domain-containing protein [Planctomycetales bacterium ZRK34]|nr:DUF2961 domain-containing protein [Planctomycetales bacterium ZRK34]
MKTSIRMTGWVAIWLVLAATGRLTAAEPITFATLLNEMTQRETLAQWPAATYTCRQASSYDRASTSEQDKSTWFANADRSQFVRIEQRDGRKEYVMMDVDGPGAVVRMWATWHGPRGKEFSNGTLRIYLDGESTPTIEGPIADVLDRGLLVGPPLSQGVSPQTPHMHRGHNLYLPIPYARHCKITYQTDAPIDPGARQGGEALYYQINYRTYEPGTAVESFTMDQLDAARLPLARAQHQLSMSGLNQTAALNPIAFAGPIAPGQSRTTTIDGPGAVRELTINLTADDIAQAMRSTVLEIQFDGEQTVWCPVGDLFGADSNRKPYQTWYTRVTADGSMTCWWVMPFAKSCRITLHNLASSPVDVTLGEARISDWTWNDRSMHFHTTWKQLTKVDTQANAGADHGAEDVNYVTITGQGVYVGDTLTVFNGAPKWWGEGDEKIFVDGETFPSHFGTGTEDYYGYAWCRPEFFEAPFHAQPTGAGNFAIKQSVNSRHRALDAIPFKQSLRFEMELWHWAKTRVNFAPATFWYARPGASCNVKPDPETAALPVARERGDVVEVKIIDGLVEGEALEIVKTTGGNTLVQNNTGFGWSQDAQLWWRDAGIGDKLTIRFPVDKTGVYDVVANLTKAVDYAVVKLAIDGQAAGSFDRYHTAVETDPVALGRFDLKKGTHELTVEIVGINPNAIKSNMFGLDYLQLKPAK